MGPIRSNLSVLIVTLQHANPKTVGYVTSGFWAGITIGRFAWGYFMPSYVPSSAWITVLDEILSA
jgi:fucose permease